ncbi:MAG TPA: hypothetical protein VGO47_08815, partial [Chlamydiales bacterium]|nr:hypothetical protein [Chlamydiales bacterium]
MKSLPTSYHQVCSSHAELTGMPKLGCESNVYFNSLQINLSPCSSFSDGTTNINTLGQFGQKHKDPLDSLLRLSIMGCLS